MNQPLRSTRPASLGKLHPIDCRCHHCVEARGDADRSLTVNEIAAWALAGMASMTLILLLLDPRGFLAGFGL